MGVIYKLTSPSGKSYIGKTKRTFAYRIKRHLQRAKADDEKPQCKALNAALRQYGFDNFKVEILVECNESQLNYYEIKFIEAYNTLAPNGYNLTTGGEGREGPHREESKDKMSEARRKYRNYTLPRNVVEINHDDGERHEHGFRVILDKTYTFISSSMTMDEKFQEAIECYETIKSGGSYEHSGKFKRHKDDEFVIPQGIVRRGDNGFALNKKGYPRKTFDFVGKTRRENLILALKHYVDTVEYEGDEKNYEQVHELYENLTSE